MLLHPVRPLALALALVLSVGACSGDPDEPTPAPAPSSSAPSKAPAFETEVAWGKVTGRLPRDTRKRVARDVGQVVDRWVRAAYVGGDYPRRNFTQSWPGFTGGARSLAHRDRALTSNQDIGARIDGVVPRHSTVRLDALAVHQRAVGLTARLSLAFRTTGKVERVVRVRGSLYLTRTDHGWKVFGYDLAKGAV